MAKIYLAGGLFNAGERLHNLFLEKYLKALGHKVILPQREANRYISGDFIDLKGVAEDCRKNSVNPENIYVGCIDGTDADSGTAVEYGLAHNAHGKVIVYRTDFRTDVEKEVGVNGMLKLKDTIFIYYPCYFTELDQVEEYYKELARRIDEAIQKIVHSS